MSVCGWRLVSPPRGGPSFTSRWSLVPRVRTFPRLRLHVCSGIISNKEGCTFRREPNNPYDAMAIGVHAAHDPDRNKASRRAAASALYLT